MNFISTDSLLVAVVSTVEEQLAAGALLILHPSTAWLLTALAWLCLTAYCVMVGWAQKKEANGTLSRLLWVSFYLGLLGALPVLVIAVVASRGPVQADQCRIAAGCTFFCLLYSLVNLFPPVFLRGTKEQLPLITDKRFLSRVQALAEKMGIPVPLVRLLPSLTSPELAMAFVGSLQAPQLVVTDGILHRLEPEESDAIIAHELAHIVNHSLFVLAAVTPLSCAVTTAVASWLPIPQSILFGCAFIVGLRRLVNRRYEFDCDLRAARVTGFRVTSAALAKIHAAHPISNKGVFSLLSFATATHPARDIRLAALFNAAPADDRPELAPDANLIRWHRLAAGFAGFIWLVVIGGSLILCILGRSDRVSAIPFWMVSLLPTLFLRMSFRHEIQQHRQRTGERWGWLGLFMLAITIVVLSMVIMIVIILILAWILQEPIDQGAEDEVMTRTVIFGLLTFVMVIGGFSLWLTSTRKRRTLQQEVNVAMQLHDFHRVVDLCAAEPQIVQRNYKLQYLRAIAQIVCENREAAIAELEQLRKEKPKFPLASLALGELLLDSNQAERAIEVTGSVASLLPRDVAVPLLEARALRRLGRFDAAEEACQRAMSYDPQNGCLHGIMAAIELDRGNLNKARELVMTGLDLAPGDPYVLVVRAEVALQMDPEQQAAEAVKQAIDAIHSNRLTLLQHEITRLESAREIRAQLSSKTTSSAQLAWLESGTEPA